MAGTSTAMTLLSRGAFAPEASMVSPFARGRSAGRRTFNVLRAGVRARLPALHRGVFAGCLSCRLSPGRACVRNALSCIAPYSELLAHGP
jgi:hypothetical protein